MKQDKEVLLMKGNEAIAHAAIRCGCDGYFGYPITPQSEILETLAAEKPWETTGMVVLQAESEVASIYMIYGGGASGKRVMTSSSSPGVALMQEGITYMAGAEVPGVIVNVQRGGPGLGTIQPSQGDYNQATRGGGNGDYNVIVLAPCSVQEMADFVDVAFDLAFKYRTPVMILSDGIIGQMMEKVVLKKYIQRIKDSINKSWNNKTSKTKRLIIYGVLLAYMGLALYVIFMPAPDYRYKEYIREETPPATTLIQEKADTVDTFSEDKIREMEEFFNQFNSDSYE